MRNLSFFLENQTCTPYSVLTMLTANDSQHSHPLPVAELTLAPSSWPVVYILIKANENGVVDIEAADADGFDDDN